MLEFLTLKLPTIILTFYEKSLGICLHWSEWKNIYFETVCASLAYQIARKPLYHRD